MSAYSVRPPFAPSRAPTPYENPTFELRLMADGPRLRIFHQGQEAGVLGTQPPGTAPSRRWSSRLAA
ncbi:hypothetical protein [Streptomyces sp. NPDC048282]|uniref:hypothetical protein n=1 Tax=Streptomyces sp. NPDC048282 TaxID=3365528 RepID=UPI003717D881